MIIPFFLPHAGCPERCRFCDQKISGGKVIPKNEIQQTILSYLSHSKSQKKSKTHQVAFYGGTFTGMHRSLQIHYLQAISPFLKSTDPEKKIHSLRIATRPDEILNQKNWINELKEQYSLETIELGVQSFEPENLERLGRSHKVEENITASKFIKSIGLRLSHHIMIGISEHEITHILNAFDYLSQHHARPDYIRIHPLLIFKGTAMETDYEEKKIIPLTLPEAIDKAAQLGFESEKRGIKVLRYGLQPNELIGQALIAGPYHPAFGELVKSKQILDHLSSEIACELKSKNKDLTTQLFNLTLNVPERFVSQAKGQKNSNIDELKRRFNLTSVSINVIKKASQTYDQSTKKITFRLCNTPGSTERRQI